MTQQFYSRRMTKRNEYVCPMKGIYKNVIATLFITVKEQETTKMSIKGEWITNLLHSHIM